MLEHVCSFSELSGEFVANRVNLSSKENDAITIRESRSQDPDEMAF
jgi:hypothetical protein